MNGYPQFSFWIVIALAKICFFHIVINRAKNNIVVLVGNFLKKSEYTCTKMRRTYGQKQKEALSLRIRKYQAWCLSSLNIYALKKNGQPREKRIKIKRCKNKEM